jgi:hypothetical protein
MPRMDSGISSPEDQNQDGVVVVSDRLRTTMASNPGLDAANAARINQEKTRLSTDLSCDIPADQNF